jgi:hypothetical protein
MSSHSKSRVPIVRVLVLSILAFGLAAAAFAQSEAPIYTFTAGQLAASPNLISDSAGNLYGATYYSPTVYELSPPTEAGGSWTYTALDTVPGIVSSLAIDKTGNIFGTTNTGGIYAASCSFGCGTIFELIPPTEPGAAWAENILFEFTHGEHGPTSPEPDGITVGPGGVLYGAATRGGNQNALGGIFALRPPTPTSQTWTFEVLYEFQGRADGYYPNGPFTIDKKGNLYGTTRAGGIESTSCVEAGYVSCGTVFELSRPASSGDAWTKTTLYDFSASDGYFPNGGLILDASGKFLRDHLRGELRQAASELFSKFRRPRKPAAPGVKLSCTASPPRATELSRTLYGATDSGGSNGVGAVFEVVPRAGGAWAERVVYSFPSGLPPEGQYPNTGVLYESGALYGATSGGGTSDGGCSDSAGCGVVYQITR